MPDIPADVDQRADSAPARVQSPGAAATADPGRHYWLELKRGRAPLSAAQEQFRQELLERSVTHGIARSFDEAVATLRQWAVLRPCRVQ